MHDIRIQKGQTIEKGSIAETVLKKKCKVEKLIDDSIFGIPYYGIGYPIQYRGERRRFSYYFTNNVSFSEKATAYFFNREK